MLEHECLGTRIGKVLRRMFQHRCVVAAYQKAKRSKQSCSSLTPRRGNSVSSQRRHTRTSLADPHAGVLIISLNPPLITMRAAYAINKEV